MCLDRSTYPRLLESFAKNALAEMRVKYRPPTICSSSCQRHRPRDRCQVRCPLYRLDPLQIATNVSYTAINIWCEQGFTNPGGLRCTTSAQDVLQRKVRIALLSPKRAIPAGSPGDWLAQLRSSAFRESPRAMSLLRRRRTPSHTDALPLCKAAVDPILRSGTSSPA
jgi:hypothetical protein